ncbi:DUF1499 domain-containing protein [Stieleria sp. TO1_6]|uniref:DUF1499 domain-containing protein n=1 Tax=Stieleria tagensis TaxID=2956795 RepID=UPI00209B7A81|nr:DUF1499 domain-containing protein [Stieleria tagensis]MCO8120371.1 DUF1499 domain-containing protein [Stieleria tagensis]
MTKPSDQNVTPKRNSKMIGWIVSGIVLVIFAVIALRIDDWGRDWTQNTASLSEDASRAGLRPLHLDDTPQAVADRLRRWTKSQSKWDWVSSESQELSAQLIQLTRTTPLFRFVDDVQVTIAPDIATGGTVVQATSRSRIGKGDLGQNPRNLIELTTALSDR